MKSIKNFVYIFFILIFFNSCTSFSKAGKVLRNEKVSSTDEFLVKKKDPLVLPPDYNEIPKPKSMTKGDQKNKGQIKEILRIEKDENSQIISETSIEESILKNIKK
tara:strand:+ start:165 stop:482 length:318 start_codon:yes stop_codon:yes gene_type:complete